MDRHAGRLGRESVEWGMQEAEGNLNGPGKERTQSGKHGEGQREGRGVLFPGG